MDRFHVIVGHVLGLVVDRWGGVSNIPPTGGHPLVALSKTQYLANDNVESIYLSGPTLCQRVSNLAKNWLSYGGSARGCPLGGVSWTHPLPSNHSQSHYC